MLRPTRRRTDDLERIKCVAPKSRGRYTSRTTGVFPQSFVKRGQRHNAWGCQ